MDKLLETLGKILEKLLSSKTLWIIIIMVAILSVAILVISSDPTWARRFGLEDFASCDEGGKDTAG
ncbi:MAG: hypothetical protein PVG56_15090, partial [Anaerolineae bacterium]